MNAIRISARTATTCKHLNRPFSSSRPSLSTPWFVEEDDTATLPHQFGHSRVSHESATPPPSDAPAHLVLLHSHLVTLPLIEPSSVLVARPPSPRYIAESERLPSKLPLGKRKRGGTYTGDDLGLDPGPIWSWLVLATVKEGTEGKGAINSVMRSTRNVLAKTYPHLALPPKTSLTHNTSDGWGFLDIGETAVHITSHDARSKWFSDTLEELEAHRARRNS